MLRVLIHQLIQKLKPQEWFPVCTIPGEVESHPLAQSHRMCNELNQKKPRKCSYDQVG